MIETSKDRFIKRMILIFIMNTGILLGPVDLLASREFTILSISVELVGERNNESLQFINKLPSLSFSFEIILTPAVGFRGFIFNDRTYSRKIIIKRNGN